MLQFSLNCCHRMLDKARSRSNMSAAQTQQVSQATTEMKCASFPCSGWQLYLVYQQTHKQNCVYNPCSNITHMTAGIVSSNQSSNGRATLIMLYIVHMEVKNARRHSASGSFPLTLRGVLIYTQLHALLVPKSWFSLIHRAGTTKIQNISIYIK